jgi:predicted AAA+ superfamily ATPase
MYFKRQIDLLALLKKKSYFLFGPRSTGKTYWIKKSLPKEIPYISLNQSNIYSRLIINPSELVDILRPYKKIKLVIIDEIQKIPELLDEVQEIIENDGFKFLLTGSSARKLKRGHANMLGGRAGSVSFYPLSYSEIPDFDLKRYLTWGGIPRVYLAEDPLIELDSYIRTYLEEEIRLEANIRNLAPFHRFLKTAALCNGQLINYASLASDASVPASTIKNYFEILSDTLIATSLEPWLESKKRKAIQTAKFYFFDPGITHFIAGTENLDRNSSQWGESFEQFILMELKSYISYNRKRAEINFWRSTDKYEVDFIINSQIAIEVKSTKRVAESHLKGLRGIQEEQILKRLIIVSEDPIEKIVLGIEHLNWKSFLDHLWQGKLF